MLRRKLQQISDTMRCSSLNGTNHATELNINYANVFNYVNDESEANDFNIKVFNCIILEHPRRRQFVAIKSVPETQNNISFFSTLETHLAGFLLDFSLRRCFVVDNFVSECSILLVFFLFSVILTLID